MNKKFDLLNIHSIRPVVKRVLQFKKSGSALDLGTSVGRHALFLAEKGFTVVAVDERPEVLAALKEIARLKKLPVKIVKADIANYKPSKKFDVVLCNMVLHFIPDDDKTKIVHAMQNATKKEGVNVFSNFTDKNPKGTRPHPVKTGALKAWYEQAGWKILYYKVGRTEPMKDMGNPKKMVRFWTEDIIAQKP
jgi:2-polyprenyl-3-methyl-5-hydroxy-6-metoxy-1,4-benzoquinol methylase